MQNTENSAERSGEFKWKLPRLFRPPGPLLLTFHLHPAGCGGMENRSLDWIGGVWGGESDQSGLKKVSESAAAAAEAGAEAEQRIRSHCGELPVPRCPRRLLSAITCSNKSHKHRWEFSRH